jgi:SSS family solute:Na+ symporter
VYVFAGGLKACAWADLIQGAALVIGGVIVAYLAFSALGTADDAKLAEIYETRRDTSVELQEVADAGAVDRFFLLNQGDLPEGKLHMKRPIDDKEIPWSALLLGLWIPNFFYWGLNQYITQRTLGSKSLAEGQKGIVFAAFLKLIIPFVVVIPGILAYNLYQSDLRSGATTKNAKTIATFAPDLYDSLSDAVKPTADDPRNVIEISNIENRLAAARELAEAPKVVFRFTEVFAGDHPDDARRIMASNAAVFGVEPPGDEDGVTLSAANNAMIAAAEAAKNKATVKELVLRDYDAAFPILLKNLLAPGSGLLGFVLAAIFGAVVSSLASMLNSASTIASMDLYRKVRKEASQVELVTVGRICVVLFVIIAMLIAPALDDPAFDGIFTFIQEFQGFISPGVLAVFLFGLLIPRAPRACGTVGLVLSPLLYGLFKFGKQLGLGGIPGLGTAIGEGDNVVMKAITEWSFLDRMSLTFVIVLVVLGLMTLIRPLRTPVELPVNENMNLESSKGAFVCAMVVVALTAVLYYIFW